MTLSEKEKKLLKAVLMNAVKNGNTVNHEAFVPNGDQYKDICKIIEKL